MYAFLRKVPLFEGLSEDDLERLCQMVSVVQLAAGEELFSEGDAGDKAYVIEEGKLEIVKVSGEREVLLAVRERGEVIGEMALLEDSPRMASARARTEMRLLAIDQEQLDTLIRTSGSAARAMFYTVLARWRSTGAQLRQSEKMAQLGTLTAGVAHELNNPAAAVRRSADQLLAAMDGYEVAQVKLGAHSFDEAARTRLAALSERVRSQARSLHELDTLARADLEAEIEDALYEVGVEEPWELAPALVELHLDGKTVASLGQHFAADVFPDVVAWMSSAHAVRSLLNELGQGASRISGIVKALKTYSYLDQAPVQEVDVHEGLDNTLIILRSKLKAGIEVRRDYGTDIPPIQAFGSELNQVWTNLLDNAADAVEGRGIITIRTRWKDPWVVVEIEDDGPGIPPDVKERIFDAFFTTKAPGKGTGLGLDISWRIVVHKHRGNLQVASRPGRTVFCVSLPLNPSAAEGASTPVETLANASEDEQRAILESTRTIAVVGMSSRPERPAHSVPKFLVDRGYEIFPVNPKLTEVLGRPAVPDLRALETPIDVVLVFRPSEAVPGIVDDAIAIGAKVVWLQEGIVHEQAAETARAAGLQVVMNTCMRSATKRLMPPVG